MVAKPLIHSTLFFFIRNSTPLECFATMPFLRSITLGIIEHGLVDRDAFFARVGREIPHVGGVQQGFGGNAAHEQARAAQLGVFLDQWPFSGRTVRRERRQNSRRGRFQSLLNRRSRSFILYGGCCGSGRWDGHWNPGCVSSRAGGGTSQKIRNMPR